MTAPEIAVEAAESPVLLAARGLHMLLELAELRGLPMPFAATANARQSSVTLHLRARDDVLTWAEVMGVDYDDETSYGLTQTVATGSLLDVPVRVVKVGAES